MCIFHVCRASLACWLTSRSRCSWLLLHGFFVVMLFPVFGSYYTTLASIAAYKVLYYLLLFGLSLNFMDSVALMYISDSEKRCLLHFCYCYTIVVTVLTQLFSERAVPCQELRHVEVSLAVFSFPQSCAHSPLTDVSQQFWDSFILTCVSSLLSVNVSFL